MSQFGATGKNPPWVRNTPSAANLGQPTQLASSLQLVQATLGGPGVTSAQAATPVALQQQQTQQQQAVAQQTAAYNAASLTALGLAQVGMEQTRDNVFLVQNAAGLQPGTVLSQPGVALSATLTAAPAVGTPTGLTLPTTLATAPVGTVSYPSPRMLQHPQFQPPVQQAQAQMHTPKQRVFTGTVCKLHDSFGFVDDDVFFQTNCVKGQMPKVGDRVLVEASYNPTVPFKWNAARIQVLPNQSQVQVQPPQQQPQSLIRPGLAATPVIAPAGLSPQITLALSQPGTTITLPAQLPTQAPVYTQVPPPVAIHSMPQCAPTLNRIPSLMGARRHSPPPIRREREREVRRDERRERDRHRDHERERERDRIPVVRKRSRSPCPRSRSPPRRRPRVAPRYVVHIPKISLDMKEANVMEVRKRYSNMYVPSDFFFSSFVWMDAFPLHRPFTLERPCTFHIMNKEVDPINENDAVLEPPDADHAFTCKVMLLASPSLEEIFHKSCALAEDPADAKENFVHPTRLISFLVGLKSKNETMAIGGPWSPSLDGPNPDKDPSVLIKTAIRTCRALTGIDLSPCTKWYRFAEVFYHRGETMHKGRAVAARVETVVLFLPDVWSCTPTRKEWHGMAANYKKQLQKKLHEETPEANENQPTAEEVPKEVLKKDPSHHSELDPKSMKITDLRHELEVRNLSCKGLKSQLIARLTKALKAEHDKEEEDGDGHPEDEDGDGEEKIDVDEKDDERKKKEEEDRKKEEKEKAVRERRYTLPESPSILVHPSRIAKGGKFDCTVMSLSVLLDYRQEDNKEYSFEVSLFAELFNEMLMRDFGFWIYRALSEIPEKKDSEEKDKEKDKKKEKEKKDEKREDKGDSEIKKDSSKKEEKKKKDEEEKDGDEENEDEEDDDDDEEEMEDGNVVEMEEDEERKDRRKDGKKNGRERKQEAVKLNSIHPMLLLAFVYFDQNHCGYLLDKDLEEILYTLGLKLSRAQVRKLLQNAVCKDKMHYRKLTDKPLPKDLSEDKTNKDANRDITSHPISDLETFALGNASLLTAVKYPVTGSEDLGLEKGPPDVSSLGLVMHNGALLDITKLLQQMQRSEKARTDTELKLKSLQEELDEVKEVSTVAEQTCQKLSTELNDYKKRLRTTEGSLRAQQEKASKFWDAIEHCYNVILPVVHSVDGDQLVTRSDEGVAGELTNKEESSVKHEDQVKQETVENGET